MNTCTKVLSIYVTTVFVLLFIGGITLRYLYPCGISATGYAVVAVISACLSLLLLRKTDWSNLFSISAIVFMGSYIMSLQMDTMQSPKPEYTRYNAVVLSKPKPRGKTSQIDAMVVGMENKRCKEFKVRMTIYPTNDSISDIRPGDGIDGFSVFTKPKNFTNSHFNYQLYLYTQGFKAETFVYSNNIKKRQLNRDALPLQLRIRLFFDALRNRLSALYSSANIDGDNLAILSALTLGDKSMLSKDIKENYSKAGASHILALSGLHLSIIYTLLTLLLWRKNNKKWWRIPTNIFILMSIWGYVILVGSPLSAVRSAIMLTIYNIVNISQRNTEPMNSLSLAAFIILLFSPLSIFDIGFQMSFVAVAAILLLQKHIYKVMETERLKGNTLYKWVMGMVSVSVAAQIGTAPIVAFYFGRFSCYFLSSNFIAIPLAMILLYCAVAMFIVGWIPVLQYLISIIMNGTVNMMNSSLDFMAKLPFSSIEGINISIIQIIAYYAIVVSAIYLAHILKRRWLPKHKDYVFPED